MPRRAKEGPRRAFRISAGDLPIGRRKALDAQSVPEPVLATTALVALVLRCPGDRVTTRLRPVVAAVRADQTFAVHAPIRVAVNPWQDLGVEPFQQRHVMPVVLLHR